MKIHRRLVVVLFLCWVSAISAQSFSTLGRLSNLSTRGFVGTGDSALVVGFVVSTDYRWVLARVVGPSLSQFGVSGVLSQPTMTIVDSTGRVVAENLVGGGDSYDLRFTITAIEQKVGAFAVNPTARDCSIYIKLSAGAYTMVVRGAGNTSGNALAEIYEVPEAVAPDPVITRPPGT